MSGDTQWLRGLMPLRLVQSWNRSFGVAIAIIFNTGHHIVWARCRLGRESPKSNPREEKRLADEGMADTLKSWPEC